MRLTDFFTPHRARARVASLSAFVALCAITMSLMVGNALAQSVTQANPSLAKAPLSAATPAHPGPQWQELSPAQQKILQPLAGIWNSLLPERKSKWLAMAQNYPGLAPAEQMKLQSRMVEWATLKPQERERARLNYAETKKLSTTGRTAEWEAYQALSPEEKQKLAEKAHPKPIGAAIAPKPVAPNTLTVVPLTRRTAVQNTPAVVAKPTLDRNTLLPVAPRPTKSLSSAPATLAAPAASADQP